MLFVGVVTRVADTKLLMREVRRSRGGAVSDGAHGKHDGVDNTLNVYFVTVGSSSKIQLRLFGNY